MESMGNALTQPFQGPQGAENTLKLAAVLAPRLNFGNRPLQQGEGEGLRNLLGAFGQFAEQKRRKDAEGHVMTGLQGAFGGTVPWSALPISDLPETTQRMIMEEMGRAVQRQTPSVPDRLAALAQAVALQQQGGDPSVAFKRMGLPQFGEGDLTRPSPQSPVVRNPVPIASEADLAPSLNTLSPTSGSPFGLTKWEMERRMPSKTPGEVEARAVEEMNLPPKDRLHTLRRQTETSVTLAQSLNDINRGIEAEKTRLWGGVNSSGMRIQGMNDIPVQDMIGLIRHGEQAKLLEERLASEQGRLPQVGLHSDILPTTAQLSQIEEGLSSRLKRDATPNEVIREYAKWLLANRKRTEPSLTPTLDAQQQTRPR